MSCGSVVRVPVCYCAQSLRVELRVYRPFSLLQITAKAIPIDPDNSIASFTNVTSLDPDVNPGSITQMVQPVIASDVGDTAITDDSGCASFVNFRFVDGSNRWVTTPHHPPPPHTHALLGTHNTDGVCLSLHLRAERVCTCACPCVFVNMRDDPTQYVRD